MNKDFHFGWLFTGMLNFATIILTLSNMRHGLGDKALNVVILILMSLSFVLAVIIVYGDIQKLIEFKRSHE